MADDTDFKELTETAAERVRDGDRRRLNDSSVGRETGEMAVMYVGEAAPEIAKRKKQEATDRFVNELMRLMNDPEYAAAVAEMDAFLNDAMSASDLALLAARAMRTDALAELRRQDEISNRLPDGRAVFRKSDGKVVDVDGREIEAADLESIVWREGAPTWEAHVAARKRLADAERHIDEILLYQNDLGDARNRLEDPDNPFETPDAIHDHKRKLEKEMPGFVKEVFAPPEIPTTATQDNILNATKINLGT